MTSVDFPAARGQERLGWDAVPAPVREWVESTLGSPVASVRNVSGGFSPGLAAVVDTAAGDRAFVKAVGASLNPNSPGMHRHEAAVLRRLPAGHPVAPLVDAFDDGDWVALICEFVDGHNPALPWRADELTQVLDGIDRLAELNTPTPADGLATAAETFARPFAAWRRLAADERDQALPLDEWSRRHLTGLAELEAAWESGAAGGSLLHFDLRADNVLLTADGAVFVDWASACTGAAWVDLVLLLPSVAMQGGPAPDAVFRSRRVSRDAPAEAVDAVLAAVAGYFTRQSLLPAPPNLPTLRPFQAAQGVEARRWLAHRLGWD